MDRWDDLGRVSGDSPVDVFGRVGAEVIVGWSSLSIGCRSRSSGGAHPKTRGFFLSLVGLHHVAMGCGSDPAALGTQSAHSFHKCLPYRPFRLWAFYRLARDFSIIPPRKNSFA